MIPTTRLKYYPPRTTSSRTYQFLVWLNTALEMNKVMRNSRFTKVGLPPLVMQTNRKNRTVFECLYLTFYLSWNRNFARSSPTYIYFPLGSTQFPVMPNHSINFSFCLRIATGWGGVWLIPSPYFSSRVLRIVEYSTISLLRFLRHPSPCGNPWSLTWMGIELCGWNRK